jgi:SNF2 family DNA or RNA helicase
MIDIETQNPTVALTEDKVYLLSNVNVYLNYNQCGSTKPIIRYDELPRVAIKGGLICSEPGLGKTFTTLAIIFSTPDIRTLVIVPNIYNLNTWTTEIQKHFNIPNVSDYLQVITFDDFRTLSIDDAAKFQRIVIDEIHEMYSKKDGNFHLFEKVLGIPYRFCWGLTATPNIDEDSMYNIIRFITCKKDIRYKFVGNFKWVHDTFKDFIIRHIKNNITGLSLPNIIMNNMCNCFSYFMYII